MCVSDIEPCLYLKMTATLQFLRLSDFYLLFQTEKTFMKHTYFWQMSPCDSHTYFKEVYSKP